LWGARLVRKCGMKDTNITHKPGTAEANVGQACVNYIAANYSYLHAQVYVLQVNQSIKLYYEM